ncbi:MAG: CDGSH iron-sulfur domain-containing protein, partial [Coriobacteriales bacterium]|nr:CDGSH iron-sulfur domain-containing protein [Coriobacteriales bacterium]
MSDAEGPRITVSNNGPYLVRGGVPIQRQVITPDAEGESQKWTEGERLPPKESCGLCRCGRSDSKPYCDGSHTTVAFDGTETADRTSYDEVATAIEGPNLTLLDDPARCAEARFCHRSGGAWNLVLEGDPEADAIVIREAKLCPSGRYTAVDRHTGHRHEPELEPSIGLVDDPGGDCAGPLWIRGRIPIFSAEGVPYEVRNRVT